MIGEVLVPRVYEVVNGVLFFLKYVNPIKMSVTLNITPLSYATMQLPHGESLPTRGYVEIYTSMGSVGFFRVRAPEEVYGEDVNTSELEHAIVEVGDFLVLNAYDTMVGASDAMRIVFNNNYRGFKWQLGDVSALGDDLITIQADHISVLEAMLAIMDQKPDCMLTYDFGTNPWTVAVAKRGTTVSAEGRLSRNVNYATVSYDDSEFVTRCYYEYKSGNSTAWDYVDTDMVSTYGLVEKVSPGSGSQTHDQALAIARAYAEKRKKPKISVTVSAEELSSVTGEEFDTFTIGKLCRLALYDYGNYNTVIERVITQVTWNDVFNSPEDITLTLEDEKDPDIVQMVRSMPSIKAQERQMKTLSIKVGILEQEDGDMTANANIPSGEYFQVGRRLYKATAAIAYGETIVPGMNCIEVSSADVLNTLTEA